MADQQRGWSPGQAMLPQDPDHHNRALDRAAAEHLREVAPHLAPSAPAPPQPEPAICRHCAAGGCAPAPAATGEMSEDPAVEPDSDQATWEAEDAAAVEKMNAMSAEAAPAIVASVYRTFRNMLSEIDSKLAWMRGSLTEVEEEYTKLRASREAERQRGDRAYEKLGRAERERDEAREQREDLANEILAERSDLAAANASAEEAERKALMAGQDKVAAQRRADSSHRLMENERAARVAAEAQREAYRQDRDLTAHRLAAAEAEVKRLNGVVDEHASGAARAGLERDRAEHRLKLATEEIVRVRLAYDDPSLDATDGAHPAWWRGSDAGVAGAVRIVNEALDGPLPLPGCVGGADLEAVRQRVAALRASVARLVEAGDEAWDIFRAILDGRYTYSERSAHVEGWLAHWAAATAQVKP